MNSTVVAWGELCCTLHRVHCILHCTLHTAHCTLHTALHTAYCILHTAYFILHCIQNTTSCGSGEMMRWCGCHFLCSAQHSTTLYYTPQYCITLHNTVLHSKHCITLHDTILPFTSLDNIILHSKTLYYTPQHIITLHNTT